MLSFSCLSLYLQLGWPLHEGDIFHSQANIEKMSRGEQLTDEVSGIVFFLQWIY